MLALLLLHTTHILDYLAVKERKQGQFEAANGATFYCVRGWASSIPLIMSGATTRSLVLGGGYFLDAHPYTGRNGHNETGHGIVLDPGHNFINNMHLVGLRATQIKTVFVSHDHGDHSADTINIDDVLYDLHKRSAEPTMFDVNWYVNKETYGRLDSHYKTHASDHGNERAARELASKLKNLSDDIPIKKAVVDNGIELYHGIVKHDTAIHTFASIWKVALKRNSKLSVVYTADMEWNVEPWAERTDTKKTNGDNLTNEERLRRLLSSAELGKKRPDLLVAHMSQPDPLELLHDEHYKKYHLGLNGLVRCVQLVNPRYLLVGEFWGGLSDHRLPLVNLLVKKLEAIAWPPEQDRPELLPLDMGLECMMLEETSGDASFWIRCTKCAESVTFEEASVVSPDGAFGRLQYLCLPCLGEYRRSGRHDVLIGKRVRDEYRRRAWVSSGGV